MHYYNIFHAVKNPEIVLLLSHIILYHCGKFEVISHTIISMSREITSWITHFATDITFSLWIVCMADTVRPPCRNSDNRDILVQLLIMHNYTCSQSSCATNCVQRSNILPWVEHGFAMPLYQGVAMTCSSFATFAKV